MGTELGPGDTAAAVALDILAPMDVVVPGAGKGKAPFVVVPLAGDVSRDDVEKVFGPKVEIVQTAPMGVDDLLAIVGSVALASGLKRALGVRTMVA